MNGYLQREQYPNGNLLGQSADLILDEPNIAQMRSDRLDRTRATMQALDPLVAQDVCPRIEHLSTEEKAAVCIQAHIRGYLDRKKYVELLYAQFEKEEEMRHERALEQVEEGELLVENHRLEVQLDDNATTRRNKLRHYESDVVTLQRAWRAHKRRQQETNQKNNMSTEIETVDESSETESAGGGQPMTLSTPDEAETSLDKVYHKKMDASTKLNPTLKIKKFDSRSECDSVVSDYSEMAEPIKEHFLDNDVKIIKKEDLVVGNTVYPTKSASNIERTPEETDLEYNKRVRKTNLLSLAQEFAALKRINAEALPFDLHKEGNKLPDFSDGSSMTSSAAATPSEPDKTLLGRSGAAKPLVNDTVDEGSDVMPDVIPKVKSAWGEETQSSSITTQSHTPVPSSGQQTKQEDKNTEAGSLTSGNSDKKGKIDVYRDIESTLPELDWTTLEQQLQKAAEEERTRRRARRNDREEIRRKLAMGDEDYYGGERTLRKPNLQTRLQGGMNLQICFVNEGLGEPDPESRKPATDSVETQETNTATEPPPKPPRVPHIDDPTEPQDQPDTESKPLLDETGAEHKTKQEKAQVKNEDFFEKQARLQAEARLALAQARPMAHMQLEVEKQTRQQTSVPEMVRPPVVLQVMQAKSMAQMQLEIEKSNKSPVKVGIPGFQDGKKKRLTRSLLQEMNLAQIQVLLNDLHSQIEALNEDLVQALMNRDDLHMEQDSMLVDIEDLTRRAQEYAQKISSRTALKKENRKS